MIERTSYAKTLLPAIFLIIKLLAGLIVFSQTEGDYRSVTTAELGNWKTLSIWERFNGSTWETPTSEQGYPGEKPGTGNVLIQPNKTGKIQIQVSPAYPIGSLTVGVLGKRVILSFIGSGMTLNVKNDVNVIEGSFEVSSFNAVNYHTLRIGGDLFVSDKSQFMMVDEFASDFCTVVFNGTKSQTIIGNSSNIKFYDLHIQNTSFPIYVNNNVYVAGDLIIDENAVLEPSPSSNIFGQVVTPKTVINKSVLKGKGKARVTRALNSKDFISQYGVVTMELAELTIDYAGLNNQSVDNVNNSAYGNVILSGDGIKSFENSVTINGCLSLEGKATVAGAKPKYGPLATLQYKGSTNQKTGLEFVTPWTSAGGIVINNSGGSVILNESKTINTSLTLANGLLEIPANMKLTFAGINVNDISSGETPFDSKKHIVTQVDPGTKEFGVLQVNNVPVKGFTFPLGNSGCYLPATIAPSQVNSFGVTVFTGFTIDGKPGTALLPGQRKNVVNAVWNIESTANMPTTITLEWPSDKAEELEGDNFKIALEENIGISHFDGSRWDIPEGISDAKRYTATRTLSSFSPVTVAIKDVRLLPVRFSNVKVSEKPTGVQIDFTNLTESDVEYYEVERSTDDISYISIKRLAPAKNDNDSASYTYLDTSAPEGRSIYRIKAVETTGKTIYSSVVNITLGAKNSVINIYASGGLVAVRISGLPAGKYQFRIFSAAGQLLKMENIDHSGGSFTQTSPLISAGPGVYIFSLSGPVQMQKKFVVQ